MQHSTQLSWRTGHMFSAMDPRNHNSNFTSVYSKSIKKVKLIDSWFPVLLNSGPSAPQITEISLSVRYNLKFATQHKVLLPQLVFLHLLILYMCAECGIMYMGIKLRPSVWAASTFIPSTFLDIIFAKVASNFIQSNRVRQIKTEMSTRLTWDSSARILKGLNFFLISCQGQVHFYYFWVSFII